MNRTDRLLAIVLELQAKGWQRAEDLAATFEISKRTIYRDMQALGESGVPVLSEPGRGFALVEGYFLPPLSLSTDEAITLLLGADMMEQAFDELYQRAAAFARSKITAILPEAKRAEVRELQSAMGFVRTMQEEAIAKPEVLRLLRTAILQRRQVRLSYHTRYAQDDELPQKERIANPYALVYVERAWYLVAYCHLRQDRRHFRLDRIDSLELLPKTFERPASFSLHEPLHTDRLLVVEVLFDHSVARWVLEAPTFHQHSAHETPDGLLVTLRVRREDEILQWLLSWGASARVLSPDSLRERVIAAAHEMLAIYEPADALLP